jgi:16S rRNA (adenine1518-N6/adenine1519-N6)-dimethyltransferase
VKSTVIRLTIAPKLDKLRVPETEFIDFLKLSFAQKRKTLWNNLKPQYSEDQLRGALEKAGVKPQLRAEALSLEKSAALFRALNDGRN